MKKIISLWLALAMALTVVPAFAADAGVLEESTLADSLVLRYSFDLDSETPSAVTDDTGNGYDAEVLNTSQSVSSGFGPDQSSTTYTKEITIEDGTAYFPGIESVSGDHGRATIVNGAALKIPEEAMEGLEDYTVSMWVKADSGYAYANALQRFFDFGIATSNSIFVRYTASSGNLRFQDRYLGTSADDSKSYMDTTNNSFNDQWGLLTVTYNASEAIVTVYVNGEEVMSDTGKFTRSLGDIGELTDSTYGMFLGRTQWYNSSMESNPDFCGWMDDVRLYSRELSSDEVRELYSSTNPEADKVITGAENPSDVYTIAGVAPSLPTTVKVNYSNSSSTKMAVTWESISPELYASDGSFQVSGTVDGTSLSVSVTVYVVSDPEESVGIGLEAQYTFEEDDAQPETVKDMSGNGNDATAMYTYTYNNTYRRITIDDGIATFPGYGYATISQWDYTYLAKGGALLLPDDFNQGIDDYTVSMWVKADSSYVQGEYAQRLFDLGNCGDDYYNSIFVSYNVSTGELVAKDRKINVSETGTLSDKPFNDQWGLLSVSYSKSAETMNVYVNGELWASIEGMTRGLDDLGEMDYYSNGMYIGRNQWYADSSQSNSNPDFCGSMDDVRIYNRALAAEEIAYLYEKTNPERKIEVTVNTSVYAEDLTTLVYSSSEVVEVGEGIAYSVTPDETYTYNGAVYSLSEALSTTSIAAVSDDECTIEIVYAIKALQSIEEPEVETYKGTAPSLPETVEVTYQTGDVSDIDVVWDSFSASKYADVGTFTVGGTTSEGKTTASVVVYEITEASVASVVYTSWGETPSLPETAKVVFSHKPDEASYESIDWEEIDEEQIEAGQSFTVSGTLTNYPDVSVSTTVSFIYEASVDVEAVADTYTGTNSKNSNYGTEEGLKITSTAGGSSAAGYDRYAFLRFPSGAPENPLSATVKIYLQYIDNTSSSITYTLYAIDEEYADWGEEELTWNTQDDIVNSAVAVAQVNLSSSAREQWMEFDVSEYILENPDLEYYSFYVGASTCAAYVSSRESGENAPTLSYVAEGWPVTVRYECSGSLLQTETVLAVKGAEFTYADAQKVIVEDAKAYVVQSVGTIDSVDEDNCTLSVEMALTDDISFESISVSAYYDTAPTMPSSVTATVGGYEVTLDVEFDCAAFDDLGIYEIYGSASGLIVPATVKAYGRYLSSSGGLLGYASKVICYYAADGNIVCDPVEVMVRTGYTFDSQDYLTYYPQLINASVEEDITDALTEPVYEVVINGTKVDGVSAIASAELDGTDPESYTVNVSAYAANTAESASSARIIIVKYDEEGNVIEFKTSDAQLPADMTGREAITAYADYSRTDNEDIRIYLWDFGQLRPVSDTILVSELADPPAYSDEVLALIPEYADVQENVERANSYRQSTWSSTTQVNGIDLAFWDTAAYHTGNIEAYFTFGNEDYKTYSTEWAEDNEWSGNTNSGDKSNWRWGYNQTQGSVYVLFGDWQTCFQTYLDLNLLDPDDEKIARVQEVMEYQMSIDPVEDNRGDSNGYWWWADALYMVPPVMTKLYLTTGNEGYLDKLYEYYTFAAELMYDGDLGIPNEGEEYTTAASLNSGASYSDPDNYANLFFRDASYVYPLNPNSGHEDEKNFWARGNGWVFAGLAKILNDIPTDYEHYSFFYTIYTEMAKAIIDCQQVDDEGNGFWTQSMLQDYPKGNNGNDEGYETSGTAFMTYGLFWGINSGILDEDTYLESALRGWRYLSNVALLDDGQVGYCQAIGSTATSATAQSSTQPFGFGAFLLAGSEVSRWVGGVSENNDPYLQRKMWSSIAVKGANYYVDGSVTAAEESFSDEDGVLYVPLETVAGFMGLSVSEADGGYEIIDSVNNKTMLLSSDYVTEANSVAYASASALASLVGKYAISYGDVTVISHKADVFYSCDENSISYLSELLN